MLNANLDFCMKYLSGRGYGGVDMVMPINDDRVNTDLFRIFVCNYVCMYVKMVCISI